MKGQFRVIPQLHLGIRFRSRTEARWAQFFDDQDIPFIYEPVGIGDGDSGYLVDFQLTAANRPTFFEVKPHKPTREEQRNLVNLAEAMRAHVFVACGPPSGTCEILKFYSDGTKKQWYFACEIGKPCGFLVESLYAEGHTLALRKTTGRPGRYGRGPQFALDAAGRYQFNDPLATRRVRASTSLLRSPLVQQMLREDQEKLEAMRKAVGDDS